MVDSAHRRRRGAVALTELVAGVLRPLGNRRGFAVAELAAAWTEVIGPRYADCTRLERVVWPRGADGRREAGVLHLVVSGPKAVLIQHELGEIAERVNAFLGYGAISRIRLRQGTIASTARRPPEAPDPAAEARAAAAVAHVDGEALRAALTRLGRGALAETEAGLVSTPPAP
jgi:hypothetical protein